MLGGLEYHNGMASHFIPWVVGYHPFLGKSSPCLICISDQCMCRSSSRRPQLAPRVRAGLKVIVSGAWRAWEGRVIVYSLCPFARMLSSCPFHMPSEGMCSTKIPPSLRAIAYFLASMIQKLTEGFSSNGFLGLVPAISGLHCMMHC